MPDLKTTKEERAALRADILDTFPDHGSLRQSREKSCLALLDDLDTIEQALEERDNDLHMRIRAGYDRCIADTWRAEVAKVKLRADTLEAEVERLRGVLEALFAASQQVDGWDWKDLLNTKHPSYPKCRQDLSQLHNAVNKAKVAGLTAALAKVPR